MAEQNKPIQAPWRAAYLKSLGDPDHDPNRCFLCDYWNAPENDTPNLVIWRTGRVLTVMNRYPYTNGHLLIAPADHIGQLEKLPEETLTDIGKATRDAVKLIAKTISPHGYNVGMNLGRSAGAGVPDHLHNHVVPRWNGDTNFMTIVGDTRIIPDDLLDLHQRFLADAKTLGLRQ
jgi:ATP adenylyltransferase